MVVKWIVLSIRTRPNNSVGPRNVDEILLWSL